MRHLNGDTLIGQREGQRECFIPLHTTDVVDFLSLHPALSASQQSAFRQLASLILSLLHHLYRQRHAHLTYIYTAFPLLRPVTVCVASCLSNCQMSWRGATTIAWAKKKSSKP